MKWLKRVLAGAVAAALASLGATPVHAGAGSAGSRELFIIGGYEVAGESAIAANYFDDGAKFAVKDLEKKGFNVRYERIPVGATSPSQQEQAFLRASERNPDAFISLGSSTNFIPVGPKVAETDLPTFATTSPTEGVKNGTSGGDNIFLVRPLNEQWDSKMLEFACVDLKKKLKLDEVKIGLVAVNQAAGEVLRQVVDRELPNYKKCRVVTTQANAVTASDMTQQVLAIKQAGANVVLSFNFPGPFGVLANQLSENGVDAPLVGGTSLAIAVDFKTVQNLEPLYAVDDCVPPLVDTKKAKQFIKQFEAEYGYVPNQLATETYDMFHVIANAVQKVGHDHKLLIEEFARTKYDGICSYATDRNNVLSSSLTAFKYGGATDPTKVFVKKWQLAYVPSDELAAITTTTPPTTVAP